MAHFKDLKKWGLILLSLTIYACQTRTILLGESKSLLGAQSRLAASVADDEDSIHKHMQTFIELMNEPDEDTRRIRIKNFFDRQRSFFYIAQELVNTFDIRLDELYKKKVTGGQITAEEFQAFNEMRFKNLIAWEFSERNLHEMIDLYRFTLENAKSKKSDYQSRSRKILSYAENWFESGWQSGDRMAIISLAQNFEDINSEIFPNKKPNWVPRFEKYTTLSKKALDEAYLKSQEYAKSRKLEPIDYFIEKKWQEHLEIEKLGLADIFSELYDARTPQALDTLEPDPGPNGQVTGNRFPQGKWAFTFDDGPHPIHTPEMFNTLISTKTIGTFFWLTQNILRYPELVKQAKVNGFSRACHSFTHANLPTLNPTDLNHEVNEAIDGFTKVVGEPPTLYRCPYGACGGNGSKIRQMIAARGALEIFWNVDTLDWQDKNPDTIFLRAKKQVDILGRGIILFHDIHPQSVIAAKTLIEYMQKNPNLTIASLKELISESRGKAFESP